MASVIEKLTAQGSGEQAGALNEIMKQLWPNIDVAGSKMIKEIADPMFKSMLPGPLSTLHFTKVELGTVPMVFSDVRVSNTAHDGIKLDLNVDWNGKCNIELDGDMIPQLGVESVELHGRLSILLCPITNVIPLIGAAQIAFINPPQLKLNFTGAADVADLGIIDGSVRKVIISIINSIAVLPNRYLYKLDSHADYFKTFHQPLGIIRITTKKAWGFAEEAQSATKKLFSKLTRASPDCYAKVSVGAEPEFKTKTLNNTTSPAWDETSDFVVTDLEQCVTVEVQDDDVGSDDLVGMAVTTVHELLSAGGKVELGMVHKGKETPGKVAIEGQFFEFAADGRSFSTSDHKGEGKVCGLLTILVAGAFGIKGPREELSPSVVVTWGEKHRFQTAIKSDAPGTDISNPAFDQNFRVPVTSDMVGSGAANLRIAILNKDKEIGATDIPFVDLLKAPNMILEDYFNVSGGPAVRASFSLRGLKAGNLQDMNLPVREK